MRSDAEYIKAVLEQADYPTEITGKTVKTGLTEDGCAISIQLDFSDEASTNTGEECLQILGILHHFNHIMLFNKYRMSEIRSLASLISEKMHWCFLIPRFSSNHGIFMTINRSEPVRELPIFSDPNSHEIVKAIDRVISDWEMVRDILSAISTGQITKEEHIIEFLKPVNSSMN